MGYAARANPDRNGTQRKLQRLAATIVTQAQFERLLRAARHPAQVRALLAPLLKRNLPCCAEYALGSTIHATSCPTMAVVLTDDR